MILAWACPFKKQAEILSQLYIKIIFFMYSWKTCEIMYSWKTCGKKHMSFIIYDDKMITLCDGRPTSSQQCSVFARNTSTITSSNTIFS